MPFHMYGSILAMGAGVVHLIASDCENPLPELGLLLCGILVVTGVLCRWKAIKASFRKVLYQFHVSLMVSGVLLAILLVGHAGMSSD
jgi:hypothetical protein